LSHKKIYLILTLLLVLSLACSLGGNTGNTGGTGDTGSSGEEQAPPTAEELSGAACLIGTWQEDTAEISSNLDQILSESDMHVDSVEGAFYVTVDQSQIKFEPQGYTVQISDQLGTVYTGTVSGYNTVSYTVDGDKLSLTVVDNTMSINMEVFGTSIDLPLDDFFGVGVGNTVALPFTCNSTTLVVQAPPEAHFESSTFTRVSP